MKFKLVALLLLVGALWTQTSANVGLNPLDFKLGKEIVKETTPEQVNLTLAEEAPKECTVTYRTTLEDGTKIESEVTFSDLSGWQCTKLKVGLFLDRIF
ncbi:MAG: hypothetical protein Sapg2KO_15530 [Saprospiraceae bacterium]